MLVGRFGDTTGRPYFEGRLYLPRLHLQSSISFLLDTGADSTALMPADAVTMGVAHSVLRLAKDPMLGIGGAAKMYIEKAILLLVDEERLYSYALDLTIQVDPIIRTAVRLK